MSPIIATKSAILIHLNHYEFYNLNFIIVYIAMYISNTDWYKKHF